MRTMYGDYVWGLCMRTMYGDYVWGLCIGTMYEHDINVLLINS